LLRIAFLTSLLLRAVDLSAPLLLLLVSPMLQQFVVMALPRAREPFHARTRHYRHMH
jgi:hypothetical protein